MTFPFQPDKISPELRLKALEEEVARRQLPIPPETRTRLWEEEAARRSLLTYGTFTEFVQVRNPSLLEFEHVQMVLPAVEALIREELRRVLVLWPTQYFKALADDTPIATPTGWKAIGDLRRGDSVFAADGTVTKVRGVTHRGVRPTYWVRGEDGGAVRAADDHEWKICMPQGSGRDVRTTQDLAENGVWSVYNRGKRRCAVRIPVAASLELPEVALPIPPYTLGLWLGDGSTRGSYITVGHQDIAEIQKHVKSDGFQLEQVGLAAPGAASYLPVGSGGRWDPATSLRATLRKNGLLQNKHIPALYFRASIAQRLALLQGLMDSDGHVSPRSGRASFNNTNLRLAQDVQELVCTLGAKAFWAENRAMLYGKDCGPAYTVGFYLPNAARLRRKATACNRVPYTENEQAGTKANRAISFEIAEPCQVTCIAVEHPSKLFLAGRHLMVTHNSEIWSRLLPAYYLLRNPAKTVALASYGSDLAWELSGDARDYYASSGGLFRDGSSKGSTRNWRIARTNGRSGGMWATGIGGPALGRGYDLGIVDDPIDPLQVQSRAYQKRFAQWWPSKWLRGQRPGKSAIVFVMQRLAMDDPVAWLLEREHGKGAHHWHILAYDEIKSNEPFGRWAGPRGFPETCTTEPDPRAEGEVLAPTWRSPEEVERLQAESDPTVVAAQRQQRPMRPTGDFWQLKWFEGRTYEELPKDAHSGGWDWDPAYTKEESNSATAGVYSFCGKGERWERKIYIEDVDWDWLEFPELIQRLKDKKSIHYVEKKASGKSVVQTLRGYEIAAEEVDVRGDKLARSGAAQPAVSGGRVYVNKLVYDKLLYGEGQGLLRITAEALMGDGEGLDLNDAFVQAVFRHLDLAQAHNRVRFI